MKTCKLTILDEVNVKFTGIEEPRIRKQMMDCVKEIDHRAKYTPAGRMGRWNGEVSFMTVGGNTYLHLLYVQCTDKKSKHFGKSMMDVLTESGYHVDVEDKRKVNVDIPFDPIDENYLSDITFPAGHPAEGEPIILREHQVRVINALLANRHGIGLAATGSGKTIICAALARKVQQYGRTIVIVPSTDLVSQTEDDYKLSGLDVGVVYGGRKEFHHTHTICTWQSLNSLWKQYKRKPEGHVEWDEHDLEKLLDGVVNVIVDECLSGDTLIKTPHGDVPIKDLNCGDKVYSYDESTNEFIIDTVVKRHENLPKSSNSKMLEIEMEDGTTLQITDNHKVLTNNGWIEAGKLTINDEILNFNDGIIDL